MRSPIEPTGVIINISSVNALAYYHNEAYSAAKVGILSLTRSLAVRYGPCSVLERVAAWYPLGRLREPEDVARAALFLAPDDASWISGATLPVDGGLTAGNQRMTQDILE